ncbi:MAG: hypothetical protein GY799_01210 [Desulfobulbaceae bacterium]|nr:hypothetical protein [Desulfobulbaceae bacterium]
MGLLAINNKIQSELTHGKSREEIFQTLSDETPTDSTKFAYCLASIPHSGLRHRYLKHNAILFILLLLLACFSLASEWPINFQQPTLFIVIKILVPIVFSYFVYQFHGGVYRLLGMWCVIDLTESLLLLNFTTGAGLAKVVVLIMTVCLTFFIAKKVFPNLKTLGPKQDEQGRYIL